MSDGQAAAPQGGVTKWKEKDLENWLLSKPQLPDGERLLPVGRQRALSRMVDLLFLDQERRLVLVELKSEKSTRLAVGQVLEYLSTYHDYEVDDLCEDCGRDLRAEFHEAFGQPLNSLSEQRRVIIVAPGFDVPSSVACSYLGQVLRGVGVVMITADRSADGFSLRIHEAPHLVSARKLAAGSLAVSPSGQRLFCVLESGATPLLWWAGRLKPGNQVTLPSKKRRSVLRTNRRLVPASEFAGIDTREQNSVWQSKDDTERFARLLGCVTTPAGEEAVVVRIRPGKPPAIRHMRKKRLVREWLPSTHAVPGWAELAKALGD